LLNTLNSMWSDLVGFTKAIGGGIVPYLAAVTVYIASSLVWGTRWYIILRRLGSKVSFKNVYTAIMGGILFNNITPTLKLGGEGFRAAWLRLTEDVPTERSLLSILYERVTEVPGVVIVALIAILSGLGNYLGINYLPAIAPFILASSWIRNKIDEVRGRLRGDVSSLLRDWRLTIQATLLSIILWLMDMLRFYLIALAVGVHLSIGAVALLSISYLVLSFGPTPAGIGFVEGGLTGLLVGLGVPVGSAGLIVLGERLISSVLSSLLGLLLVTVRGGIKLFKEASRIAREEQEVGKSKDSAGIRLV